MNSVLKDFFNTENLTKKVDPGLALKNGWHLGEWWEAGQKDYREMI